MLKKLTLESLSMILCCLSFMTWAILVLFSYDLLYSKYTGILLGFGLFVLFGVSIFPPNIRKRPFGWKPKFYFGDKVKYFNDDFIIINVNADRTYDIQYLDINLSTNFENTLYDIDESLLIASSKS